LACSIAVGTPPVTNVEIERCGAGGSRRVTTKHGVSPTGPPSPRPPKLIAVVLAVLIAVPSTASAACVAVGARLTADAKTVGAIAERFHAGAWTPQPLAGAPRELDQVTCATPVYCVAVGLGADKLPPAELWNGSAWAVQGAFGREGDETSGVSCASPTACVTVGRRAALRWSGTRWTRVATPEVTPLPSDTQVGASAIELFPAFFGVSCVTAGPCTAVGGQGGPNGIRTLAQSGP
jgi:hypothetical protein